MRLVVAFVLLALVGCSSDPAPTDAAADNGCPLGRDGGCLPSGSRDVTALDATAWVDAVDAAPPCDTGPCRCPDGRQGNYVCGNEWCVCTGPLDAGVDVGSADVATDDGILRPDRTAPMDDAGNLLCGEAMAGQGCATHDDCTRCIPRAGGMPWCCIADPGRDGVCVASTRPCADVTSDAGR